MQETVLEIATDNSTWQRTSFSHLKRKPFDLCNNLYTAPSYSCIAWSEDNFIAFTSIDGVRVKGNHGIQHPIYIIRPEHATKYIALATAHTAPIRIVEWSPLVCGQFLLSVDGCERICIWRMRDNIDDWACVATYKFESVIAAKWISSAIRAVTLARDDRKQSPLAAAFNPEPRKGLQIPPGMPAIITVSALMVVTVIFQGFIEGMWGCISCNLITAPPPLPLSCADLHVDSSGRIFVALGGPHLGNSIDIYEISLDLFASSITSHLKSRVELGVPDIGPLLPSFLLSPLRMVPVVCHTAFDPLSDGIALLTVSASLGMKGTVRLDRWEYKPTTIQREKVFPASLSPSLRNQHIIEQWVLVASVNLAAPQSSLSQAHGSSLNPNFITTFRCTTTGTAWLGYLGGFVEARDCKTLKPLNDEVIGGQPTLFSVLSETMTTLANIPPIVVATGMSPNCALVCMAHYSGQFRAAIGGHDCEQRDSYCRKLADILEWSMVRGVDPWDVFALLQQAGSEYCHLTILNVGRDMASITEPQRHFFVHKWEAIRSYVYGLAGHNIASLDCQARSYMFFVIDTIRTTLTHTLPASLSTKSFDEALSLTGQPTTHEMNVLFALVPFAEWIIDFSLFFLRCLSYFTKTRVQDFTEQTPFRIPEGYSGGDSALYFPMYSKHIGGVLLQIPFVSFLFDTAALHTLLELIVLSGVILSKVTTQSNKPKWDVSDAKRIHGLVFLVLSGVSSTAVEVTKFHIYIQTFRDSLDTILASTPQQDITLMDHDAGLLDLDSGQGNKSNIDIITRQPLNDKQYRKCLRCNRTNSLIKSTTAPWRERWNTACPICGGKWSVP